MERGKKLFSDVLLFALSNFGSKVLVFLLVPLYTHSLTTEEYGIADLITVTIQILFPILTLSITEATLRFLLDRNSPKEKIMTISLLAVLISFAIVGVLTLGALCFKPEIRPYAPYFLVIYLFTALNSFLSNFTRGIDRTKVFAVKGLLYTASLLLFNLLFLLVLRIGLSGYLLSIILAETITVVYMFTAAKEYRYLRFRPDRTLAKEMLRYSIPLIPTIIAWWIMQVSDKYIVIAYCGMAASGVYAVSYKIPSLLSLVTTIFNQAWQISAVKSYEDRDYGDFFGTVYGIFFAFSLLISAALILAAKLLGRFLFAADYFIAWRYVPLLVVAYFFSGLSGVMASAFTTAKKTNVLFYSTVAGAAFNLVFNFLFIPRYGVLAAAATTMLGFGVTLLIRNLYLKKMVGLRLNGGKEFLSVLLIMLEAVLMTTDYAWKYPAAGLLFLLFFVLYYKTVCAFLKWFWGNAVKFIKKLH